MEWIKVLDDPSELSEGSVAEVSAGDRTLALSKVDGTICALEGRCAHDGGPLGRGSIENGHVCCPWHGWEFEPCSGEYRYNPEKKVRSFAVEVRDDGVYVGI